MTSRHCGDRSSTWRMIRTHSFRISWLLGKKNSPTTWKTQTESLSNRLGGPCEALRPRRVRPSTIGGGRTTYRLDRRQFAGSLTNASSVGLPGDRTQAQTVEKGLKVGGR